MYTIEVHEKYKHYEYCIVINPLGYRCGYVKTEEFDVAYKKSYDDLHGDIHCHGGLTYNDSTTFNESYGYWIGFDCAHHGDSPDPDLAAAGSSMFSTSIFSGGAIRTKDYCVDWCESMIRDIVIMNRTNGGLRVGVKELMRQEPLQCFLKGLLGEEFCP